MSKLVKAFTLIELLIVIVIIGILANALITTVVWVQGKVRDTQRIADLKQIQSALELYAIDHKGEYPVSSTRRSNCINHWSYPTSGLSWYIPDLAPDYITTLPLDPRQTQPNKCYLYRSNWIDYMVMAHLSAETNVPDEFIRLFQPLDTIAIFTPWAKMR